MASSVVIPLWLALLIGFFAVLSLLDRILVPGLRWLFRRRVNRAIDELNTRLKLRIQPFKLTKRQALIDRLVFDEEVIKAVERRAERDNIPREAVMKEVHRYAREIVPAFNAYAYFRIGAKLARWLSNLLYRVRLGYSDDDALRKVDPDSTVIFVMNHRSNMDYVLVTYMASSNSALSYAVGEWARVFMLQSIIRTMGAYFIRRGSDNDLYRKVLARYVAMATKGGVTQAIFPEGGLSRDGSLRDPKLGLFSYMVSDFDPDYKRDVVFIPVGLNYDRVLEDRILTASQELEKSRKKRFSFFHFLRFIGKNIWMKLRGRWYSYGYACVSFGHPVSLKNYLAERALDFRKLEKERRFKEIENLGRYLMNEVGRVVPALPVSLVASAVLQTSDQWISEFELKARVSNFISHIESAGVHVHLPRMDRDYAVSTGLRMLILRRLVEEKDGLYRANSEELVLLSYYANAIAHLLPIKASVEK
ncbi:MAG: 1-acyl-sn-glycerol-3-phosphate acyltransferase [Hyphomicrobiaceae bacterium]|nr:1-acyl-sn-glycerol-3-phosphate acyltransferase [Hyphomicrobiaceae bacterium]